MSGGGIGGAVGAGLGTLLAPETGGLSLLIPAALGAGGGALGAAVTGGNPLTSGLEGGAGGLAGGFLSGLLGGGADAASGADSGGGFLSNLFGSSSDPATQVASDVASEAPATATASGGSDLGQILSGLTGNPTPALPPDVVSSSATQLPVGAGNLAGTAAQKGASGGIGNWIGNNPLKAAGLGLGAIGAFLPSGSNPINVGGNASSVQSTNPGFNASLPQYGYNSVKTPYTGSWYSYGERPQTPMIQNTLTPPGAARGGLIGFAQGGQVPMPQRKPPIPPVPQMPPMRNMSVADIMAALPSGVMGGATSTPDPTTGDPNMDMSPSERMGIMRSQSPNFFDHKRDGVIRHFAVGGMVPGAPPMQGGQPHQNPAQQAQQFQMGKALGQAMRKHVQGQGMFTGSGSVKGPGGGQDDKVPAKLSNGEYVHSADVVAALGDGSTEEGGRKLKQMDAKIRAHKTSHGKGFPPKAKNPLSYLGGH